MILTTLKSIQKRRSPHLKSHPIRSAQSVLSNYRAVCIVYIINKFNLTLNKQPIKLQLLAMHP